MDVYSSGPDLTILEPIQFLDIASGGAFLHLPISAGRAILETILEISPYTDAHHDSPKE